jgi:hypothetical protein
VERYVRIDCNFCWIFPIEVWNGDRVVDERAIEREYHHQRRLLPLNFGGGVRFAFVCEDEHEHEHEATLLWQQ